MRSPKNSRTLSRSSRAPPIQASTVKARIGMPIQVMASPNPVAMRVTSATNQNVPTTKLVSMNPAARHGSLVIGARASRLSQWLEWLRCVAITDADMSDYPCHLRPPWSRQIVYADDCRVAAVFWDRGELQNSRWGYPYHPLQNSTPGSGRIYDDPPASWAWMPPH